ncbi:helicase associated domain-containing protein [[Eubacterium] hominis]|uniref:helicase associated domain-containing protein n=1 Tax=[Eubacterium] hominis TaxID=2764325 RepID=UPI003A4E5ABB
MNKRIYLSLHWDDWYELAVQYRKKYGDLLIPSKYCTVSGYKLGRWIERQRNLYHKHSHIMTDERKDLLDAIDMVWRIEDRFTWDFWIQECKNYYIEHGDLQVPVSYENCEGVRLGNWITIQRKKNRMNLLIQDQIKELELYHMRWEVAQRRTWSDWYHIANSYYKQYGNLNVKTDYIDKDGNRLGMWISIQREKYRHIRKPYLKENEIELLNELNIKW